MAPKPRAAQVRMTAAEMEEALTFIRSRPASDPAVIARTQELALACRGFIVSAAQEVADRTGVPLEDLVQEGFIALLPALREFEPGRAPPGQSFLPKFVKRVALRAMGALADSAVCPTYVSATTRKVVARARRAAAERGCPVEAVLPGSGVSPATFAAVTDTRPTLPVEDALDVAAPVPDQEQVVIHQDAEAKLAAALEQLRPRYRNVLRLAHGIGVPAPLADRAIASRLGLTLREVQDAKRRGLAQLRSRLTQQS